MNLIEDNYLNIEIIKVNIQGLNIQIIPRKSRKVYFGINVFVGSKDNIYYDNGRLVKLPSGIAHLTEHLQFNLKTPNLVNDLINKGLDINGSTSYIGTNYYLGGNKDVVLTNQYYQVLLAIVYKFNFSNKNFQNELQIVKEEANLEYNSKDYKVENVTSKSMFKYGLSDQIVGTIKDLNKITYQDLKKYYFDFYNINNSVLTIIGDLTKTEIDAILTNVDMVLKSYKLNKSKYKQKINEIGINSINSEFFVQSNTINSQSIQYYIIIDIYDNINIKEMKIAIDLLMSLWSEDFSYDFIDLLHEFSMPATSFDFWYKNYNNQQLILVVEIKDKIELADELFELLRKIIKNKITKEQFLFLLKSYELSTIERSDENIDDYMNDYLSHLQFYSNNLEEISNDIKISDLSYNWLTNIQVKLDVNKYIKINCNHKE